MVDVSSLSTKVTHTVWPMPLTLALLRAVRFEASISQTSFAGIPFAPARLRIGAVTALNFRSFRPPLVCGSRRSDLPNRPTSLYFEGSDWLALWDRIE